MSAGVLVALISAGVAVCSAAFTAYTTARSTRLQHTLTLNRARLERQQASEDLIRRYREPLLLAAFDLQARIHNIVHGDFVARHMGSSDPEERHYARASTLYRLGDYFGWIEILRRGLQFLDLGEEERTRGLVERLDTVSRTFSNTEWFPASVFRLFRDEQRALGEVMLEPAEGEVRRYQCIGYATFVNRLIGNLDSRAGSNGLAGKSISSATRRPGRSTGLSSCSMHSSMSSISWIRRVCVSPRPTSSFWTHRQLRVPATKTTDMPESEPESNHKVSSTRASAYARDSLAPLPHPTTCLIIGETSPPPLVSRT